MSQNMSKVHFKLQTLTDRIGCGNSRQSSTSYRSYDDVHTYRTYDDVPDGLKPRRHTVEMYASAGSVLTHLYILP